jgi:hypothetical protein
MKSSNLAQRLEEFEATLNSLRLGNEPATRLVMARDAPVPSSDQPPRRRARTGGIQIRDQGLRPFRVR